jgi:signal transduction histidine kinase
LAGLLRDGKTLDQLGADAWADELFKQRGREKRIALKVSFDPGQTLQVDPILTLSAVENLLDNAIKYTDGEEVVFAVEDHADEVEFHVRERCTGLSPEELRVIFEPFKRVHSTTPGTGLGLAIARRAIEAQGGTIHAESSAESGCHFWFTLPRAHRGGRAHGAGPPR